MIIALSKEIQSLNYWNKKHWSARNRESLEWQKAIWGALVTSWEERKKYQAKGPMKVKITSLRKRLLDKDNLYGGGKRLVDSLKKLGLILDDSPKFLNLEYEQKIQKSGTGTLIELEDEL